MATIDRGVLDRKILYGFLVVAVLVAVVGWWSK